MSRRRSTSLTRPMGTRARRVFESVSLLDLLGVLALVVPFAVVGLRYVATSKAVYLSDDLALLDLHVRDALHWRQQLGPFDRFGWNHPGPAVFYLMSIGARIIGSGARSEFVSAIVMNLLAAIATVWVVRRRSGAWAALWCSSCLGLLALVLASSSPGSTTTSEGPLGALVSPWNPDVVIFPMVLFCVLAAAGASGSWLSLLGAVIVGSFVVQTNLSTFVIVGVLMIVATVWALLQATRTRSSRARPVEPASAERRSEPPGSRGEVRDVVGRQHWPAVVVTSLGVVVLVLMWIPPVVQQLTNRTGNMTLIWRFFTSPHKAVSVYHALWAVLAADSELAFGVAQEMSSRRLGDPHGTEVLMFVLLLLASALCIALGVRRRRSFAATIGVGSLVGFVLAVVSVTRIVGPVYGYLIVWMVSLPVATLIAVGVLLFDTDRTVAWASAPPSAEANPARAGSRLAPRFGSRLDSRFDSRLGGTLTRTILVVLAVTVGTILTVETARIPPLERASDPTVSQAFGLVSRHLRPGPRHVFVGDAGTTIEGLFTFFGLVDVMQEHGYHPRVSPLWSTQVGPSYLSDDLEPVQVVLYPPSPKIRRMRGYIGSVRNADIVVAPGPPLP